LRPELQRYVKNIDAAIEAKLAPYRGSRFYEPLMTALAGGKRLRPLLLLLSYESLGGSEADPLSAAVAVELLHTESLIHDDLIDRDLERRGAPAFHVKYGEQLAILSVDYALSVILELGLEYEDSRVLQEMARAVTRTCEGQLAELQLKGRGPLDAKDYLHIVELKTGSLFEASAKIGALIAEAAPSEIEELAALGRNLGSTYQICDDARDREGWASAMDDPGGEEQGASLPQLVQQLRAEAASRFAGLGNPQAKKLLGMYADELIGV